MIEYRQARRRHSAKGLTRRKMIELTELANRWGHARHRYIADYWDPQHFLVVLRAPRTLVEQRRDVGWNKTPLMAHYHKTAMDSALDHIRTSWARTIGLVRDDIRASGFTGDEKHWMYYVLKYPSLIQTCLLDAVAITSKPWSAELDEQRLSVAMAMMLRARRGSCPRRTKSLWFVADCNQYRPFSRPEDRFFRSAWVAVAGLNPDRRINIPLAGHDLTDLVHRKNLRIEVRDDRVVFHTTRVLTSAEKHEGAIVGADKGYRALLTISSGDPDQAVVFGAGLRPVIESSRLSKTDRERNRQRIMIHANVVSGVSPDKARRIRRRNLGSTKARGVARCRRAELRQFVDRTLDMMFGELNLSRMYVESLHFQTRGRLGRVNNMRMSFWPKGYLHRRLTYKAKANGVRLETVNAAWTSLTYPRCGFPSKLSRRSERFVCVRRECGFTGWSDAVAATNILKRGQDGAIPSQTSGPAVYAYLLDRWEAAQSGCAWGSNAAPSGSTVGTKISAGGAANNLGSGRRSTNTVPT